MMTATPLQKGLIFILRIALGWVFLWAGIRQVFLIPSWSAAEFLAGAKTFKDFYAFFGSPAVVPVASFLVKWGHLLIGLSLIAGLGVRIGASFGAILVMLYYFPRMEFPFVGGQTALIVEYHVVLAMVLVYLASVRAGQIWGLENWVAGLPPVASLFERNPKLRPWLS